MKKFLFLLAACALCSQGINAKVITPAQAEVIAKQQFVNPTKLNASNVNMKLNYQARNLKGMTDYYVFNREGDKGFVIVAGDDLSTPILGYSNTGSFNYNEAPEALQLMLNEYQVYMDWLRNHSSAIHATQTPSLKYDLQPYGVYPICGEVHWHQFPPYNNNCPRSTKALTSNGRCYAGCVPVAFSTIMKGLRYPSRGSGENSYTYMLDGNEMTAYAKFGDYPYNYSQMKNGYGETASNAQAVSELVYEVGVAFNTIYSGESSDALLRNVIKGIIAYFNFNPNIQYVQKSNYAYNEQAWYDMMYTEIDNGRPIYYMGYRTIDNSGKDCNIGHAFVLDGYDSNGKVHINWGFQPEEYNTYFDWELLSPRNDYDYDPVASGFNAKQAAIIGLCPDTTDIGGVVQKAVNLAADAMPANDIRASIDIQALSGKWNGSLRYGIFSGNPQDGFSAVYVFNKSLDLEDNEIATINMNDAYPYLSNGRTYYIAVWSPYASSYEWNWYLSDPVPFTVDNSVVLDPEYILGDVNGDKSVDIEDVTALIEIVLNGGAFNPAGDLFEDGAIDIEDVTALLNRVLNGGN